MSTREKVVAEIGTEGAKFAAVAADGYATPIELEYTVNITLSPSVERAERYADNRLILSIPNEPFMDGSIGTTARDIELEKLAGISMEVAGGVATLGMVKYLRGALYFEHIEYLKDGTNKLVKTWVYNVEVGKGETNLSTKTASVTFADYIYPIRSMGDPLMADDGTTEYIDQNGMKRNVFMFNAWPDDAGYATFGDAVPVPKALPAP